MSRNQKTKRQLSPYEKTHLIRFQKDINDISKYGEMPVEYITGKVEFLAHTFDVNQEVLIPRIESEELILLATLLAVKQFKINNLTAIKSTSIQKILPTMLGIAEVGTGCGAIGITLYLELLKRHIPTAMLLGDISAQALNVAKHNASQLLINIKKKPSKKIVGHTNSSITFLVSDLLSHYPKQLKFDLIIGNLPYIPTARIAVLDNSVKNYEPHLALDGGKDGLKLIKKIVDQARTRLLPQGKLILEVDYTHDYNFLFNNLNLTNFQLEVKTDSLHRTRFAIIKFKKQ